MARRCVRKKVEMSVVDSSPALGSVGPPGGSPVADHGNGGNCGELGWEERGGMAESGDGLPRNDVDGWAEPMPDAPNLSAQVPP